MTASGHGGVAQVAGGERDTQLNERLVSALGEIVGVDGICQP